MLHESNFCGIPFTPSNTLKKKVVIFVSFRIKGEAIAVLYVSLIYVLTYRLISHDEFLLYSIVRFTNFEKFK